MPWQSQDHVLISSLRRNASSLMLPATPDRCQAHCSRAKERYLHVSELCNGEMNNSDETWKQRQDEGINLGRWHSSSSTRHIDPHRVLRRSFNACIRPVPRFGKRTRGRICDFFFRHHEHVHTRASSWAGRCCRASNLQLLERGIILLTLHMPVLWQLPGKECHSRLTKSR